MDIAKERRGQDIKIADETRREATAKRLRETEGTPENIALQGSQIALRKARDAEADAQFQRTGKAKFSDGSEIATTPEGAVERRDSSGNVISSYKDKDSYAREQLGLIGRAGLAKTEADTKLHEAHDHCTVCVEHRAHHSGDKFQRGRQRSNRSHRFSRCGSKCHCRGGYADGGSGIELQLDPWIRSNRRNNVGNDIQAAAGQFWRKCHDAERSRRRTRLWRHVFVMVSGRGGHALMDATGV